MASTDATPLPRKNTAYRITLPIWDADGDLITGATGLDSEVSIDGGTFTDCTNEATEIATASGIYFLDLTAAEMNGDTIALIVKTTSSGAKTTPIILYPNEAGDIDVDVTAWNGTAVATPDTAGYPKVTIKDGTGAGELDTASGVVLARDHTGAALATPTNITAGTIATVTNLTNAPTSGDLTATMKTSVTTAATAATPAVTVSDKTGFSLSAGGIQAIWDALTSALTTVGSVGKVIADFLTGNAFTRLGAPVGASISADVAAVQSDTNDIQTRLPAALVSGRIDASVGAMAANTLTAAALATDAVTEIQSGLSTVDAAGIRTAVGLASANLDTQLVTIDDFLDTEVAAILAAVDTEVAAIKAKTDLIPASPAALGDIPTANANADALLDRAAGVETNRTVRQALRLMLSALGGKLSGAATATVTIRDTNDSVNRIVATVDADGNRSAVVYDAS